MVLRDFLIYSNLITSLSAGVLSAGLLLRYSDQLRWEYPVFIITAVMSSYTAQRLVKIALNGPSTPWLLWVRDHHQLVRVILFVSLPICLLSAVMSIPFTMRNCCLLLICLLISILYVVPVKEISLRQIPFVKNLLISAVWAILLLVVPFQGSEHLDEFLLIALYFFALTIPFDIRDLQTDRGRILTLPLMMGILPAKALSISCSFIFYSFWGLLDPALVMNPLFWFSGIFLLLMTLLSNSSTNYQHVVSLTDLSMALLGLSFIT